MWFGFLDDQTFRWSPERADAWSQAKSAHASVVRTVVRWDQIARDRPQSRLNPFDPAYNFRDLDDFVVHAQQRGIEVLLTLWGTPSWANEGAGPQVPPTDVSDFAAFAHAVAARYSGRYPGLPFARFFSVWNEPNAPAFLSAPDPVRAYAGLAEAGYSAIKAASPGAQVALGETAASHSPGSFVKRLAQLAPTLRFDAWAHHPYPPSMSASAGTVRPWPNVGMRELGRFGAAIDADFHRQRVPIWLTEFAEPSPYVSPPRQAADLQRAVDLAAAQPQVAMFVWLMLRNHRGTPWQSGIGGKPALGVFRAEARRYDPRNALVALPRDAASLVLRIPALELRWHLSPGARVGIRYVLSSCGRYVRSGAFAARIGSDGWVPVPLSFVAAPARYTLTLELQDVHGFDVKRRLELVPSAATRAGCVRAASRPRAAVGSLRGMR
jgi:hypothetical protein